MCQVSAHHSHWPRSLWIPFSPGLTLLLYEVRKNEDSLAKANKLQINAWASNKGSNPQDPSPGVKPQSATREGMRGLRPGPASAPAQS